MAMIAAVSVTLKDPTNVFRGVSRVVNIFQDIGNAALNLGYFATKRDSAYLHSFAWNIISMPLHAIDAAIYTVAAIIPVVPLGWTWAKFRQQT